MGLVPFYNLTAPRFDMHRRHFCSYSNQVKVGRCCDCTHLCYTPLLWDNYFASIRGSLFSHPRWSGRRAETARVPAGELDSVAKHAVAAAAAVRGGRRRGRRRRRGERAEGERDRTQGGQKRLAQKAERDTFPEPSLNLPRSGWPRRPSATPCKVRSRLERT